MKEPLPDNLVITIIVITILIIFMLLFTFRKPDFNPDTDLQWKTLNQETINFENSL